MATKLGIYNLALSNLGEEEISSLSEPREPRRVLDRYYDSVVAYCLEQAIWNFALRITSKTSVGAGSLGFTYSFDRPTDFVRLFQAGPNATFYPQYVTDFAQVGSQFHADTTPLWLHYVSNDDSDGGGNLTIWPETFAHYVACLLSARAAPRVTGSPDPDKLYAEAERALEVAIALEAADAPPGMLPFNTAARTTLSNDRREMMQMSSASSSGKRPFARLRGRSSEGEE
jgi:hypothetical protein